MQFINLLLTTKEINMLKDIITNRNNHSSEWVFPSIIDEFFGLRNPSSYVDEHRYDFIESDDKYEITLELPGLTKDNIKIEYQDNLVSISAEKKYEESGKKVYGTREYKKINRSFRLPDNSNVNGANASYENGVLIINIPKSEKEKIKQILIK